MQGNKNAIAETIENDVRSKIIKEHLADPAYYEKMSALLDEIIAARKAKAIEYEAYLKKVAELARRVEAGQADDAPAVLKSNSALRALYNNLQPKSTEGARGLLDAGDPNGAYGPGGDPVLQLTLRLDARIKQVKPDDWRGYQAKENVIKQALFELLQDAGEVERIFLIVKQQTAEY
ncbi:hypothetical protein D3C84_711190 [compost metagenome]